MSVTAEQLKKNEDKLKDMESDLSEEAAKLEKKGVELKTWEEDLVKREDKLSKKLGLTDSSEAFDVLTGLITKLHTTYVGVRGDDKGLIESITSILDARSKLQG